MGLHPTAAETTEISAQNVQPCCWGCNTLTVKGGEWFLEVPSSLTQYYFITYCLKLCQLIPEASMLPLKNPNPLSFPEVLMAFTHRWALCKLKSFRYPALPQVVLSGAVHICESKERLIIQWCFFLTFEMEFFYLCFTKETVDDLFLFPSSIVFL